MNWPDMAGLSSRQQRGLVALLTVNSVPSAAEQAHIGERTLRRWLTDKTFREAYRHASRRLFDEATGQLRAATGEAVTTLREALQSDHDGVRVRAALGILDAAVKADFDDLAARVAALEEAQRREQNGTR
jgi:HD-like signal output (HDOD) protein